jgi:ubiquinone/menaquinone biosynthesis C-methylase UbiE
MGEQGSSLEAELRASVAFDDAVEYYDETKSLPPDALAATIDLLATELGGSACVLDVGVGTGVLALPLVERGLHVDGIDLSAPMLRRAIAKASSCARVGLTVADATQLPFRDDAFDGAFMRHVLHLVPGWRQVLAEAVRVIRPGGTLVVSITDYTGLYREIQGRFLLEAGGLPLAVGLRPDDPGSLRRAMLRLGAQVRPLPLVRGRRTLTVERFLTGIEDGHYSWTWAATDERRRQAARRLRAWLVRRFDNLGRPVEPHFAAEWWAFDLPDQGNGSRP